MFILAAVQILSSPAHAQIWRADFNGGERGPPERVKAVSAVRFLPDGKTLVTAGYYKDLAIQIGELRFFNTADGTLVGTAHGTAAAYQALMAPGTLAVSLSGKLIAATGRRADKRVVIDVFDVKERKVVRTLEGDETYVARLEFSPDERQLLAKRANGKVEVWNPGTGAYVKGFDAPAALGPLMFSPKAEWMANLEDDAVVTFRDTKEFKPIGTIPAQDHLYLYSCGVSPDGKLLALGGTLDVGEVNEVQLWEVTATAEKDVNRVSAKKLTTWANGSLSYSLAFSPDGKLLASANQGKDVRIWEVESRKLVATIDSHKDFAYVVAFSPDGKLITTLGRDALKLWKLDDVLRAPKPAGKD
jgi:WD40 repeat protein